MEYLTQHIESLIFTTEHPISTEEIQSVLEETFETIFEVDTLEKSLSDLKDRYKEENFAFELVEIANGFQFLTKGAYHQTVGTYLKQTTKKRLSRAAIETLSMVAYKQPVSKSELEKIRGVSCDYSIQKLLEKELVTILGRADSPGRPLLYGTTEKFMDYFGIKSLKDLPKPKDFKAPDSEIGEAAPIEEEVSISNEEPGTANPDVEIIPLTEEESMSELNETEPEADTDLEESLEAEIDTETEVETDLEAGDTDLENNTAEVALPEAGIESEETMDTEQELDTEIATTEEEVKAEVKLEEAESLDVPDQEKIDGISNAGISIETLDGVFEEE